MFCETDGVVIAAEWWQNPVVQPALVTATAAVVGSMSVLLTAYLSRRHEQLQAARTRLVEVATDFVTAAYSATSAISPLLWPPADSDGMDDGPAREAITNLRGWLVKLLLVAHANSSAAWYGIAVVETVQRLLDVTRLPLDATPERVTPDAQPVTALWTIYPVVNDRYEVDANYRLAWFALNIETRLLMDHVWDRMKNPLVEPPPQAGHLVRATGLIWEDLDVVERRLNEFLEEMKKRLPHRRIVTALRRNRGSDR